MKTPPAEKARDIFNDVLNEGKGLISEHLACMIATTSQRCAYSFFIENVSKQVKLKNTHEKQL